jgi:hypothetical protein
MYLDNTKAIDASGKKRNTNKEISECLRKTLCPPSLAYHQRDFKALAPSLYCWPYPLQASTLALYFDSSHFCFNILEFIRGRRHKSVAQIYQISKLAISSKVLLYYYAYQCIGHYSAI